jgi:hypothetical protein
MLWLQQHGALGYAFASVVSSFAQLGDSREELHLSVMARGAAMHDASILHPCHLPQTNARPPASPLFAPPSNPLPSEESALSFSDLL